MAENFKANFTYNQKEFILQNVVSPRICPMCQHAISPNHISLSINSNKSGSIFYFCKACFGSFISNFEYATNSDNRNNFMKFTSHAPRSFFARDFSEIIRTLSARFVETYNQAYHAESLTLFEVAGPGYRKALEVLIKDYAIKKTPSDIDKIINPNFTLSQCIDEYIEDDRIKHPSIAASWLGNDATHYTKRHVDKDLEDLKQYIDTVVFFIQYDLSADLATRFVEKK